METYNFDFKKENLADFDPPIETTHLCLFNADETMWEHVRPRIHANIDTLQFLSSELQHLDVPNGISSIYASSINLESIHLADSVEQAYLSYNLISTIELPTNILILEIENNRLRSITVRGDKLNKFEVLTATQNPCLKKIDFTPPEWPTWVHIECDIDVQVSDELKAAASRAELNYFKTMN